MRPVPTAALLGHDGGCWVALSRSFGDGKLFKAAAGGGGAEVPGLDGAVAHYWACVVKHNDSHYKAC
jgi:hypothetical protein